MKAILKRIAPVYSGQARVDQEHIINQIGSCFMPVLDKYDISTPIRVAHFIAQIVHESAGLRTTEEFASGEAYEGRRDLGNVVKGDGVKFKGRGLLQLTGRENYRRYGKRLGLPLIDDPTRAADPVTSLRIACEYWKEHGLNRRADIDALLWITKRINGGTNGMADRENYLERAKRVLGVGKEGRLLRLEKPMITGLDVFRLQQAIFPHDVYARDGAFGGVTDSGVRFVQGNNGLVVDGIVGQKTREVLGL